MKKKGLILAAYLSSAAIHAQTVNQFTGSFSYDFPLLNLPSNRGSAIGIAVSYGAGIQVNQAAGEIGLGWGINTGGAISRRVSGIPDDTKTYTATSLPSGQGYTNGQGALYPAATSGTYDYDLTRMTRGLDTTEFTLPDYDSYSISGPLSGQLKLSYLKFYSYEKSSTDDKYQPTALNGNGYYRRPQFHFLNDFADTLVSRHYPTKINSGTSFLAPTYSYTGLSFTNSAEPFVGKHLSGSNVVNQNYDTASGRLATSNIVEYFTNGEIQNDLGVYTLLEANKNVFIDYTSSHDRGAPYFPTDGIGYFRVTASNGLTYHYSLPVYELTRASYYIPLKDDYSLVPGLGTSDIGDGPDDTRVHPNNLSVMVKSLARNKTAVKWLLTAVTGPDFVDNGNHIVDDGDAGYWIGYDYQLWSTGFIQRSPYYGYDIQYTQDAATQMYPTFFPFEHVPASTDPYKLSGLNGAVNLTKTEVYYLSKIRTSSHTAVFVRDVRNDEKGGDSAIVAGRYSFKPAPDLLLKRIILFKNEQLDSILLAHPLTSLNPTSYSSFDFTTITNSGSFFTEPWYQAQYSNLSASILKQVFFDQDYSLCRKYYGNVNVRCDSSSVLSSPVTVENSFSASTYSASGKLTLNRILTYDFQNVKLVPSTIFDYNASNTNGLSNPDYNPRKADYWGFYKSDATQNGYSRYTSPSSRAYTKSWSLLKITDALGGITEMEYESNSYSKVIDNEVPGGLRGAAYIYRIKRGNSVDAGFNITMEEGKTSADALTEFSSFTPSNITGLKTRICIPFFRAVCCTTAADVDPANYPPGSGNGTLNHGFVFGNCTFTVHAGANNLTDSITGGVLTPTTSLWRTALSTDLTRKYHGSSTTGLSTTNTYTSDAGYIAYSGNGFLMCEMPVGYEAYGNGIRVKRIKSTNNFNAQPETYITEYMYENGVATNEMDRFNYQVLKSGCATSVPRYDFLQPKNFSPLDLGANIGYSRVTVKNMGSISTANGQTQTSFITDPTTLDSTLIQNFAIKTVSATSTSMSGLILNIYNIQECSNVFPNIFGSVKESKVFDKNNNVIQKTVYDYAQTDQGALVENFYFQDLHYGKTNFPAVYTGGYNSYLYTVNIMRDYPVILKTTTSYGIGSLTKVQSLAKDELTGETTVIQSTGGNQSSSLSFKTPAYKFYQPKDTLDFTMPMFRKTLPLGNDMYTYSNIDSSFTPTQGNGYSASFLNATYKLYSKKIRQRVYNSGTGVFTTTLQTLPYYANNRAFIFNAGAGSDDVYGLLAKSNLYSNALPLNTINDSIFWEPSGTYNWKLMYEHTLLDHYKNLVEIRDANNRFTASRYGYKGYYKSASVSNCNYASFTFADFETPATTTTTAMLDGEIAVSNHTLVSATTVTAHTGSRCIKITGTPVSFTTASAMSPKNTMETGLQSGRIYRASVWTHTTNLSNANMVITINGTINGATAYNSTLTASSANNLATTIGNWNLLQIDFEVPATFVTGTNGFKIELKSANSGTVYFDDFIFHPVESNFSASVYNPRNGRVMSMLDGNGLATNFVYDAAGRTLEIWKEVPSVGYKRTKTYTYNYARGASN